MKKEYLAKFHPAQDKIQRTMAVIVAGFLTIHMELEHYEWAAFLPRLLQAEHTVLDRIAMHMTRDISLKQAPTWSIPGSRIRRQGTSS